MDWSPQQREALALAEAWLHAPKDKQQVFRLFGFAGTGKSTLAKHIGAMETARKGYCQYAAFTGKAAVVMRRKGCLNAKTIHSIIYSTHDKSTRELERLTKLVETAAGTEVFKLNELIAQEKANLKQPGFSLKDDALTIYQGVDEEREAVDSISLFVIDECSMVDERLGSDLLSTGVRILVLGDPAQLPPVMSGAGFFTNCKPDVLLTEIHRQALDSPIIKMANTIRNGGTLALGDYGDDCKVVKPGEIASQDWIDADQILVGRNKTKDQFNGRVRELKGYSGFLPMPGEKLVCLRNNADAGLLNGSLWECLETKDHPKAETFWLRIKSLDEDNREISCLAHKALFMGTELNYWERRDANEFNYGYALTVHKSQGSQWNNVIVYDESTAFRKDARNWLYTGVTRAAERVTVVRP